MTKVDIINITKKFNEAKTEVNKKEMTIKEKETDIEKLTARLKDTEKNQRK